MPFDPITAAFSLGSTLIDRLVPDKTQAAAAKATLVEMQTKGELDQITGQLTVDQAEASSKSTFVAGWRPFVGWACGVAFAYVYILQPFMQFALVALKVNFDVAKLPAIDVVSMLPVLGGMLGLGTLRTIDKANGVGGGH